MAEAVRWRNIAVAGWMGVEEGSLGDEREFGVLRFGRGLKPLRPVIASDWLHSVRQWAAGNADDSALELADVTGCDRNQKHICRIRKGRA